LLPFGLGLAAFLLNLAETNGFSLELVTSVNGGTSVSTSTATSGSARVKEKKTRKTGYQE
jgi:hypothetical protein